MKYRIDIIDGPGRMDFVFALPYFGCKQGTVNKFFFLLREPEDKSGEQFDILLPITKAEENREDDDWLFEGQDEKWTYKGGFSTKTRTGWVEIVE